MVERVTLAATGGGVGVGNGRARVGIGKGVGDGGDGAVGYDGAEAGENVGEREGRVVQGEFVESHCQAGGRFADIAGRPEMGEEFGGRGGRVGQVELDAGTGQENGCVADAIFPGRGAVRWSCHEE